MAKTSPARVLILGGTAEARMLAQRLAGRPDPEIIMSLAGRTASPVPQGVPVRSGGFGGVAGLAAYLARERISVLIDTTHPYAATMSVNAVAAARQAGVPHLRLRRPPWIEAAGDRWIEAGDATDALRKLGDAPRRILVALGRNEIRALEQAPRHYFLIRSVDPVAPPLILPHADYITARGPFREEDEIRLISDYRINAIIAKNSGGSATYGKIAAARRLGIDVVLLRRPPEPPGDTVDSIDDALAWLDHLFAPALRGV
jgi:precorrin-6A/cobalt-precorrin-6A reductase